MIKKKGGRYVVGMYLRIHLVNTRHAFSIPTTFTTENAKKSGSSVRDFPADRPFLTRRRRLSSVLQVLTRRQLGAAGQRIGGAG